MIENEEFQISIDYDFCKNRGTKNFDCVIKFKSSNEVLSTTIDTLKHIQELMREGKNKRLNYRHYYDSLDDSDVYLNVLDDGDELVIPREIMTDSFYCGYRIAKFNESYYEYNNIHISQDHLNFIITLIEDRLSPKPKKVNKPMNTHTFLSYVTYDRSHAPNYRYEIYQDHMNVINLNQKEENQVKTMLTLTHNQFKYLYNFINNRRDIVENIKNLIYDDVLHDGDMIYLKSDDYLWSFYKCNTVSIKLSEFNILHELITKEKEIQANEHQNK